MTRTQQTQQLIHLRPDDYHLIRPEDFGAPGLWARESVGPFTDVRAVGNLVTVHDSRFDPGCGIGHHPHQRMERLFYILEGSVDHDDALNDIQGHMGTGDLGILTEGSRGMVHSEWNNGDTPARAYILVYPTEPTPRTAAFGAIRDDEAERTRPHDGVTCKRVVGRDTGELHGDLRELCDWDLDADTVIDIDLPADEAGLVFVVRGEVEVTAAGTDDAVRARDDHTVLVPPAARSRTLRLRAESPSRVIHAMTGWGFGLRTA